ncbi:MAG TPA: hypothetical protein VF173_22550 [Thermoanaerobaculia bacterium]|nr:hypothetical protein [Thermoanaerobaculia bacterium]
MAKIIRRLLPDILGDLSSIAPQDARTLVSDSPEDLFLCALGFEPRCLTHPRRLKNAGYKARRAAYFKYATNLDNNMVNLPGLESYLRAITPNVEPLDADTTDFTSRLRAFLDLIMSEASEKPPRITLDVSVTANRLLLRCMKVLLEYDIRLRIIYSEAALYRPTKKEYEHEPEKWERDDLLGLERGVSEVMPSIDHPGYALDPLPDFLVLFPSFKPERSKAVISFVDPSLLANSGGKVAWLLGVPHLKEDSWRLDAMKKINGISEAMLQYEVSTFDYKDTLQVLERIHAEKSESHTITMSPLGSKMQALGTALFCYMHPDVRVIFSMPKEYNAAQYSEGCKDVWEIDFGSLDDLRRSLDDVGTLRIEE